MDYSNKELTKQYEVTSKDISKMCDKGLSVIAEYTARRKEYKKQLRKNIRLIDKELTRMRIELSCL